MQDKPLPKLTAEVFNRPDCPEWAKYAAVSKFGRLTFFEGKPVLGNNSFLPLGENHTQLYRNEPGNWDASDWQNSLIERSAKLPEWCKVGGYGYAYDSGYFKIIEIIDGGENLKVEWVKEGVQGTVFGCNIEHKKQARLRPYNTAEMKALVGKVVCTIEDKTFLVLAHSGNKVLFGDVLHTPEDLTLDIYKFPDGKPCGVLEHLEGGEWVQ